MQEHRVVAVPLRMLVAMARPLVYSPVASMLPCAALVLALWLTELVP